MIEALLASPETSLLAAAATFATAVITSTGRPALTLFLLFAVPTALVQLPGVSADTWLFPPAHLWLLGGAGVLAVIEHFLRGELYGELIEALPLDRLGAIVVIWLLFCGKLAIGATPGEEAGEYVPPLTWEQSTLLMAASIPMQTGLAWARNRVFDVVRDMGFGGTLHLLEAFGVAGAVVLAVLLPLAAVAAVLLVVVPITIVAVAGRLVDRSVDASLRRACATCGYQARVEASLCPHCGNPLAVARSLAGATVPQLPGSAAP